MPSFVRYLTLSKAGHILIKDILLSVVRESNPAAMAGFDVA
jgi:hypothetical protein